MGDQERTAAESELADTVASIRAVHEDSEPRGPVGRAGDASTKDARTEEEHDE